MATTAVASNRHKVDEAVHRVATGYCGGCRVELVLREMPLGHAERNGQVNRLEKIMLGECNLPGKRELSKCPLIRAFDDAVGPAQRVGRNVRGT